MPRYTYTRPHQLDVLHDELRAAGLAVEFVGGDGHTIWITVPDGVAETRVAAIVAAHDPAALVAKREAEERTIEQIRQTVFAAAGGAVGKGIATLTTAERNALIAVLLWRWGALSPTLAIRPLAEWAYGVVPDRADPPGTP